MSVSPRPTRLTGAAKPEDDTIRLSEFTVTDKDNRGYIAAETMTGTRVATQIKDLPYTVNVLTSEFFEDFGMLQLDDTLTQVGGNRPRYRRQFQSPRLQLHSQLRDGFYRLGRYGPDQRRPHRNHQGPNAGIYGALRPAAWSTSSPRAPKKMIGSRNRDSTCASRLAKHRVHTRTY